MCHERRQLSREASRSNEARGRVHDNCNRLRTAASEFPSRPRPSRTCHGHLLGTNDVNPNSRIAMSRSSCWNRHLPSFGSPFPAFKQRAKAYDTTNREHSTHGVPQRSLYRWVANQELSAVPSVVSKGWEASDANQSRQSFPLRVPAQQQRLAASCIDFVWDWEGVFRGPLLEKGICFACIMLLLLGMCCMYVWEKPTRAGEGNCRCLYDCLFSAEGT